MSTYKENNETKKFYEYIYLLETTFKRILNIIQEKINAQKLLIFNIRNLKHILFLMKDVSFPNELKAFKNKIISNLDIFKSICFGIEEIYMKNGKFSEKQLSQLLELSFEMNKFITEVKERIIAKSEIIEV
ncbi:hypothetical protein [Clostridium sp.]|uniref:hypothetical protein n=1 Tax=Clostridium sp. TaxID=1506 RepID=UPI0039951D80